MSKITHEQIRKSFDRLYKSYETDYFAPFPTRSDLDTIKLFITQQEKLDIFLQKNLELLGLYRELSIIRLYLFLETNADLGQELMDSDDLINKKIKTLEIQLKVVEE